MRPFLDLARHFIGPLIVIALLIALAVALSRPARAAMEPEEIMVRLATGQPIYPVLRERNKSHRAHRKMKALPR